MGQQKLTRILTIDQGNSSAKASVWEGGEVVKSLRVDSLNIESLLPLLEDGEIDGCAYCSVCHTDAKFLETLRRLVDGSLMVLTPQTELPVKIFYGSRSTLGNDRVAAAVGAGIISNGKGVLVVDAGTAVTIDIVDKDGNFMGGNIAPGMRLRFKSLRYETQQLPLVSEEGDLPRFGYDTESAIRCGVVGGMVSEIADAFRIGKELYGIEGIVLTGSDSIVLAPLLCARDIPVTIDNNLVGRGLVEIFRYNSRGGRSASGSSYMDKKKLKD